MPQSKHVFATLDGVRGIAALLVAIRHTETFFKPIAFAESMLAVDLFFLLSGAVICYAYEDRLRGGMSMWRFMWARIVRVYPMYITGTIIGLLVFTIAHGSSPQLVGQFALALFMLPDLTANYVFPLNTPAWSLFLEIVVNFVFALTIFHASNQRVVAVVVLAACALCATVYFGRRHTLDVGWTAKSIAAGFPRVAFSFFLGVLLYRNYRRTPRSVTRGSTLPSLTLLLAVAITLTLNPPESIRPLYELLVCFVVFPIVVGVGLRVHPSPRLATMCHVAGALSFPIYALHQPFGLLVLWSFEHVGGSWLAQYSPWIGLPFLIVLLIFCLVLERTYDHPVRRLLLGLVAKPSAVG